MSYGLRAINATIAPELVGEIGLSNTQLGSLTSAYFLAFACMQLPLGIWLDRFGPRRVDATLMAMAALGCLVFAAADSFEELWIARALARDRLLRRTDGAVRAVSHLVRAAPPDAACRLDDDGRHGRRARGDAAGAGAARGDGLARRLLRLRRAAADHLAADVVRAAAHRASRKGTRASRSCSRSAAIARSPAAASSGGWW